MGIPMDGNPTIVQASGSDNDTTSTGKENPSFKTNPLYSDSEKSQQGTSQDTSGKEDMTKTLLKEIESLKSNFERSSFEQDKRLVKANPEYLLELDESRADLIVKRLYGDKFHSRKELVEYAEKQAQYQKVENPSELKMMKEIDELKKELSNQKQSFVKDKISDAMSSIYNQYPSLLQENDPTGENWNKFKEEYDVLNIEDPYLRTKKAAKLAFGDIDESRIRDNERNFRSIPSSGGVRSSRDISPEAKELLKKWGY